MRLMTPTCAGGRPIPPRQSHPTRASASPTPPFYTAHHQRLSGASDREPWETGALLGTSHTLQSPFQSLEHSLSKPLHGLEFSNTQERRQHEHPHQIHIPQTCRHSQGNTHSQSRGICPLSGLKARAPPTWQGLGSSLRIRELKGGRQRA